MMIVKQLLFTLSILICLTTSAFASEDQPNFIIIFTDDIGWGDLSCTGHPYAETPNICRLADEGTVFENFYVTGNVCPHSRAGLMTSRHPAWFPNYTADYGFMGALTVTNLLKDAGYHTGHLGKWNIGPDPEGDAQDYGIETVGRIGSEADDPLGREGLRFDTAIDFVQDHKDEPFYLNLWVYATHTPIDPPQEFIDRYKDLIIDFSEFDDHMQEVSNLTMHKYLADLYSLDLNVGRLLDKLDELGLANNTVVAFSSDNGPQDNQGGYAGGLRAGKHAYYEGGIRVPFLVRWPGHIPANHVNEQSVLSFLDWLPTVCSLGGCDIPWDLVVGEDMSDVWLGTSDRSRTNPLFWRGICPNPVHCMQSFIRYGKWKLHTLSNELYDLSMDPGERNNVYDDNSEVVAELMKSIEVWEASLPTDHARLPQDPLPFNPTQPVAQVYLPRIAGMPFYSLPPTLSPESLSPTLSPEPTLSPAPTPQPTTKPFNPECVAFYVPFDAEAKMFCDYEDQEMRGLGNCGSGPVDMKLLPSSATEFCRSECHIGYTVPGEYVEYWLFTTDVAQNVLITTRLSSQGQAKNIRLEFVDEEIDSFILTAPGLGWHEYRAYPWVVTIPNGGLHKLRVSFLNGATNLCSLSFEDPPILPFDENCLADGDACENVSDCCSQICLSNKCEG